MSDVGNAPAPAAPAPSAPAPAANEAVIDQNPVNSPGALGSQAPDKPAGEVDRGHGRPENRRESIRRAFEKANQPEADQKKPAKRGMGDNNPPEAMQKEKPEADKKPPQAQPSERHREQGRFAKAPDAEHQPGQQAQPGAQQPGQAKRAPALPETAPYREPPPRMGEHAKAEWSAAPESVRGEVHRMAKEFEGAYRQYRGDHETMNSIRHWHDMATQHGTTLDRALSNYVGMEQKLRQDLVGGLDVIVNNLNLKTAGGQKIGLRDVAYHILNMSPEQHKLTQAGNAQTAASQQIGQLHQMVSSLAQNVQQMHHERVFTHTRSAVDQFADAHPGFDELGDLIEQEISLGFDLETAYQRAYRLRPPQAAQNRNAPPAQTRPNKSISGAPDLGPSDGQGTERKKSDKKVGRRDAIKNAINRVNGGI